MPLQSINIGQAANDGTGDVLRTAFQKVNSNFAALAAAAGLLAFNDVADNPSKLALPANTPPGYPVRITGEADRLEVFLGGDITQDANWKIIGNNTVNLYIDNESYNGDTIINGINCAQGVTTNVGWIDPSNIPGGDGSFQLSSINCNAFGQFNFPQQISPYSMMGPTLGIPFPPGPRDSDVTLVLSGNG